ncbi:inhibitor of apoptosis-promoting Bax1-domain-containing protein [Ganoderma leucocontextum]|nr:inhibitor of apoptosis-promoting Bax1-domain-containing protein [Ganoderma leucocontextum]
MAYYNNPPPPYPGTAGKTVLPTYDDAATQPLLGAAGRKIWGDVPDDFLYGPTVAECALQIRNDFVRKVYTILFAGLITRDSQTVFWVVTHPWSFYVPLFGTLVNLGLLYWKRLDSPLNYVLLSTFTLLEAFTLGIATAFFDSTIVLQALLITVGVFLGLTLFTLQSKYDFSGLGSYLFAGLVALLMTGVVGIFLPFSRTMDLVFAAGGCLLFSGYVIYDTYMITNRLSHDEYIVAAISLYIE